MEKDVTLTVPAEYLGVLKLFSAKADVRYYLNGVKVEAKGKEMFLAATDGHRLGVFRVELESASVPVDVIIPLELLDAIKPNKGPVTIIVPAGGGPVTLQQNGTTWSGRSIDGQFPDWRRVVPREVSGQAAQFNPRYIGDLHRAARMLNIHDGSRAGMTIGHNGEQGALVQIGTVQNFLGVIMPWLADKPPTVPPAWVFHKPVKQEEAARSPSRTISRSNAPGTTIAPAPRGIRGIFKERENMYDDKTEATRRAMMESGAPQRDLAAEEGETWDTEALTRDFEVLGFAAPFCVVRRKSDGKKGSLEFTHSPRVYFGWKED